MKRIMLKLFKLYLLAFILWSGAYLMQHYYSWYVVGFQTVKLTTKRGQVYEGLYTPRPGLSTVYAHPLMFLYIQVCLDKYYLQGLD